MKQTDIQKQPDSRGIRIDRVGVSGFKMSIVVAEKTKNVPTVGEFEIAVELAANIKGIHMSRFFEVITKYERKKIDRKSIEEILREIKMRMGSQEAKLAIEFVYFMTKKAPMSAISSIMSYKCKISSKLNSKNDISIFVEVNIPVSSVCPCSKHISKEGAHNQRGLVTAKVKVEEINLGRLIKEVEKAGSQELYTLLKRKDEKYVTEAMFDNPKFVEDIARDAKIILQKNKYHFEVIKCINNESIHDHNVYAEIRGEIGE